MSLLKLKMRRDSRWRAIEPYLGEVNRVLDVGCGLGSWVLFLEGRGHDVTGLDYSAPLLARAARREPSRSARWASAAAEALPFKDRTFDCVLSWGVIEHDQAGPSAALEEFDRVLAPGGRVFVTVPLDGPMQRRAEEIVNAGRSRDEFYEYYFTPHELKIELEKAGFVVRVSRPITRSPHVAYPAIYRRLSDAGSIARDIGVQSLKPLTALRADSFHMLLGIGTKR